MPRRAAASPCVPSIVGSSSLPTSTNSVASLRITSSGSATPTAKSQTHHRKISGYTRIATTSARATGREPTPQVHELTSPIEQVGAVIRGFGLVLERRARARLHRRHAARWSSPRSNRERNCESRVCVSVAVVSRGTAFREASCCDSGLPALAPGNTQQRGASLSVRRLRENLHGASGERDAMVASALHACARDRPRLRVEIDLRPRRLLHFAGAGGGQNQKLEGEPHRRRACPVSA